MRHTVAKSCSRPIRSNGWPTASRGSPGSTAGTSYSLEIAPSRGSEDSVRALVLDTGFEPGAEAELAALVRAWCGALQALGITHLTIFTSPGAPGRDALHALAARVEPYHFNIGLPEPADVATRGLYVDQLYF